MDTPPEATTPGKGSPRSIGLGLVLLCLGSTLIVGFAAKAPCVSGDWSDGRQYRLLCYTDIIPLLTTEQLAGGRLPFIDACTTIPDQRCDEYPVLTMYFMRAAGWFSDANYRGFFAANATLLWLCAALVTVALYAVVGVRALYFALAPTLLVYGTMNWDLLAVALATAALVSFFDGRDVMAGVLLGLGASAKFYPAMLALPLIAQRLQDQQPDRGIRLGWGAAGSWIVVNVPFMIAAPSAWLTFFRFNSQRCADFDSLWAIGWRYLHDGAGAACSQTATINVASFTALMLLVIVVWWAKQCRFPDFPRWTLAFPILVAFLLTSKVYSPQYGLWLLPLFALALPGLRTFVAFSLTDLAVFVTRFRWFGHLAGTSGVQQWMFELAVVLRAAVLVWCLLQWIRREPEVLPSFEPDGELGMAPA
ncbi:MAG: glycosyltransferase 87 family protein [Actinomycetota bacterium]